MAAHQAPPSLGFSRYDAIIISGTEMAKQIQKEIQHGVDSWVSLGNRRPHLSIILVGDNPASHTYVRRKIKAAAAVGICSEIILKPKDVSQEELLDITDQLNVDPRVSGILVQLPLPDHMDERTVCNGISPEKDVDGFHIINIGRLCLDQHSLIPATASAVWEIIRRTGIETFGKNVVVAGRSKNVGMPIAMLLHTDGEHERPGGDATVTIAHRYTPKEQLKIHTLLADVIIVAAVIDPNQHKELQQNINQHTGTSLVVQWLRICLPIQRTGVQSLVRELRSYMSRDNELQHMLQLEKPTCCNRVPANCKKTQLCRSEKRNQHIAVFIEKFFL
ncbi:bifunctional methylenetetrahydrofolate dehydrogenase/cyclohydrolase 2, mitochondrial isoform X4 [Ovis aries]|uniref:bifunctional methylenetetrahydrofolate dehydrogenase/cyclohydrolase 2, mitochondrial isoform X4 n=1 Tax=Ovis aries TaxID=9940 RepID=UPI0029527422|nr:bifunctional methylenetetrahydrofolate dehydrogenase/cyclohydrolase 2, mitochondrial isoform X4 [Ovis aries]